jgi:hypothetical protein
MFNICKIDLDQFIPNERKSYVGSVNISDTISSLGFPDYACLHIGARGSCFLPCSFPNEGL